MDTKHLRHTYRVPIMPISSFIFLFCASTRIALCDLLLKRFLIDFILALYGTT